MNIDYNALDAFLKANDKELKAMTDREFDNFINKMLDEFHYEDEDEQQ